MSDATQASPPPHSPPLWRQRFISDIDYLGRCVRDFFAAKDVMDELRIFDDRSDADETRAILEAEFVPFIAITRAGRIHGIARTTDLRQGECGSYATPILDDMIIAEDEPLLRVIDRLGDREFLLVRGVASFSGVITPSDLQKPPARMLLFAVVSIVELRWQQWIRQHFGDSDAWHSCVTPPRLQKARDLMELRNRHGWNLQLVDCLQFSDRANIVVKTPELWDRTLFDSKSSARDRIREIQRLRDNLAHSQDLLIDDWQTILDLARWLDPAIQELKARSASSPRADPI